LKRVLYTAASLVFLILFLGLVLAFFPAKSIVKNNGITPAQAADLRQDFKDPHDQFITSDGQTLFLRKWIPDSIIPAKIEIAVLIFHGITAHSGAYEMAGRPISSGGYTIFGLDYRGHGLSDGNRGDVANKKRWTADLAESIKYIKSKGYSKVIVLGHSLGVAAAICAADEVPDQISGLILLSGAYEGKKTQTKSPSLLQKMRILSSSVFRPSYPVVEYYREDITGANDPLFNFRYTLRFLTMPDVKNLRLPPTMNVPVLVGVGDKDELFDVDKVKEFYNLIPGDKKEFLIMKDATHAKIPVECWEEIVTWLNKTYMPVTNESK